MIRALALAAALLCFSTPLFAAPDNEAEEKEAQERVRGAGEAETLYALGAILGQKVRSFHLNPRELEAVRRGFVDSSGGKKLKLVEQDLGPWGPKIDAMLAKRITPEIAAAQAKGRAFAEAALKQPGALQKPSGLVFVPLAPGAGESPKRTDTVKVGYEGKLIDGTVFDTSAQHGGPSVFRLDQVIPCWTEGVQLMKAGGKARLVCPSSIAYGVGGRPPQIPGGATLVFEVELVEVQRSP